MPNRHAKPAVSFTAAALPDPTQYNDGDLCTVAGVTYRNASGQTWAALLGDSAFYNDTQGMAATSLIDTTVPLAWADGLSQITGADLTLDAVRTRINVLSTGVYACQLRSFIEVDPTAGAMTGWFNSIPSAGSPRGDLDLIAPTNAMPFHLPQAAGVQVYIVPSVWVLRLEAGSYITFGIGAARLVGAGTIKNTANGATEVLVRRVA